MEKEGFPQKCRGCTFRNEEEEDLFGRKSFQ